MIPERLQLVGRVTDAGPDDPVFDGLLIAGPVVILALAVLGRSPIGIGLAVLYLLAFLGNAAANAVRGGPATGD